MSTGCACVFFGVFLLIGAMFFGLLLYTLTLPELSALVRYVEHTATVLDKRLVENAGDDGPTYRPELLIRYTVDNREYQTWTYEAGKVASGGRAGKQAILDRFVVGQDYPCWYDPADPGRAVLVRGLSWVNLFLLIPLIFMAVGAGGIYYALANRGKSPEQRAAEQRGPNGPALPAVPDRAPSGPGSTLPFVLSPITSPGLQVAGALFLALFWNGVTWVFVALVAGGLFQGKLQWFLTLFLIPFVLVGLGLIGFFVKQVLVATGVGATQVEISAHPLYPGKGYEAFLSQAGPLRLRSLTVELVCAEETKYTVGTDTRTETKVLSRTELLRQDEVTAERGLPFEARFPLRVPRGAMHSFEARHNKVFWKLVVRGDVIGWPDFEREYLLIVHPRQPGAPA
jgi:hypothetical protein